MEGDPHTEWKLHLLICRCQCPPWDERSLAMAPRTESWSTLLLDFCAGEVSLITAFHKGTYNVQCGTEERHNSNKQTRTSTEIIQQPPESPVKCYIIPTKKYRWHSQSMYKTCWEITSSYLRKNKVVQEAVWIFFTAYRINSELWTS